MSKSGLNVILRINVNHQNINTAKDILSVIPPQLRGKIIVSVANMYQEKDKISVYHILLEALQLGYMLGQRKNIMCACNADLVNGYVFDADGKYIVCANAEEDKELGFLDDCGDLHITNIQVFQRLKVASAILSEKCKECVRLPLCVGTCKLARYQKKNECLNSKSADGMSLEEMALLDYHYDQLMKRKEK